MEKYNHDPEKILKKIIELERRFPVNQWLIEGVAFWPFLRTSIAYTQRKAITIERGKNKKQTDAASLLKRFGKTILKIPFHTWRFKKNLRESERLFVGAATHRVLFNGKKINRYFDVALEDFNSKGSKSMILDRGTSLYKELYPNKHYWYSLPAIYIFLEILHRLRIRKRRESYNIELPEFDQVHDYLLKNFENSEYLKVALSRKAVERGMKTFFERKEYLKDLLAASRVKNVYFLCYYSSLYYPLIAACNEIGINTTDVQHGGMGKGHWSYDDWQQPPDGGFKLLPRYFWTWDENSAKLINGWALKTTFHRAVPFGTPWTGDLLKYSSSEKTRQYILVIMTDTTVDEYILDTVKKIGGKYLWIFRMHPRMGKSRNLLERQLQEYGLHNATIQDATEILLGEALRECVVMISASSGSIIEAIQVGITPILIPSPGDNYYDSYVKEGQVKLLSEKSSNALEMVLVQAIKDPSLHHQPISNRCNYKNGFLEYEQTIINKL